MLSKLIDKKPFFYKIKLMFIKCLFAVTICLVLSFFFFDYPSEQDASTEDSDSANTAISTQKEQEPHNLQSQIAEIVSSIEDNTHIYNNEEIIDEEDTLPQEEENLPQDAVSEQENGVDNVIIKEEAFYPPENIKKKSNNPFLIAIVIDDLGISHRYSKDIIDIDAPITTSFLTYGKNLQDLTDMAKKVGKEVIVHIPMEPYSATNTAPDQLNVDMSDDEIRNNLKVILDHFDKNLIGGNNHMGSKFTENPEKMAVIMEVLRDRNMFFLDSKTSNKAIGCNVAAEFGVACASRDVFLDNENNFDYIMKQLKQTEKVAAVKGYAIAIGHPKTEMIAALRKWVETLDKEKYKLVYLSEIIKK